jgi:hypothetical protein
LAFQWLENRLGIASKQRSRPFCMEVSMNEHTLGRLHFLKTLTAIGAAGLPIGSRLAFAADKAGKSPYDPSAKFELTVTEVATPLATAPDVDATIAYAAMGAPSSDTFARFKNAENRKRDAMVKNNKLSFNPWDTIHDSNPQEILDRHEKVTLVPFLIMAGALDDNVLPEIQEKLVATYRAAPLRYGFRLPSFRLIQIHVTLTYLGTRG